MSISPQSPCWLQVLVIMTLLLGQGRDAVVPVEVLGQERGPVSSGGHQGSLARKILCCLISPSLPSTEDIISEENDVDMLREGARE